MPFTRRARSLNDKTTAESAVCRRRLRPPNAQVPAVQSGATDECFPWLDAPVRRIASADTWVDAPRLEDAILPQIDDVKNACLEIMKF